MILRRRGGSLRVVVGTSIFWLSVFYTSSEWWCRNQQIKIDLNEPNSNHLADDLKPAQPALVDVIKEGVNKGFDGNDLDFNNPNKQPPPPQNLIVDYNNDKSEEKIVRGKFNPKVELQKVESSKKKSAKSKKNSKKRKKKALSFGNKGPGENGAAVRIPPEDEAQKKKMFKENQFNLMASNMISVNRTLKDVRMANCKPKKYDDLGPLPATSVIIVFHNEAWSTLLRTMHSIVNRSPRELLTEIILVDDCSEKDFLKDDLDRYVKNFHVPVHIIRQPKREGLIRARLVGAEQALGPTLTFLDAHIEASEGWLEPLMYEIKKDRKNVICPIIDVISDETFEFLTGSDLTYGGFNWKLNFRWYPVPQREVDRRGGDRSIPMRTPTMAGGLFSIDKSYFYEIGAYDPGMDIWGGENLEMSFRVWQCGGTLLIATCSHVGHVFRKATPYTFPGGTSQIINKNNRRLAEVWMDDYKKFFYIINPGVLKQAYGDVSERLALRNDLHCKSFQWYLDNIYPDAQIPRRYKVLGEVRNEVSSLCLDTMGRKENEKVGIYACHGQGGNQVFSFTMDSEIRIDDLCLDVSKAQGPVVMVKCHHLKGNQYWEYNVKTRQLVHTNSKQCLEKPLSPSQDEPRMTLCDGNRDVQRWSFHNTTIPGYEGL